jgi:PIN domain nuclease of toxin-antitoxin system
LNLLLDTHIFLWALLEPSRLHHRVSSELENPSNSLWLSPMTTWEVILLSDKGRILLETDPFTWIRQAYARIPFHEAQLNHEVAIQSRRLTLTHQDPVDRFLGATAQVYDLTLVTADVQLLQSPGFATLSNL